MLEGGEQSVGDLTYLICTDIVTYMEDKPARFQTYAEVLGALESARLAFVEDVLLPYEREKKELNGNVF